MARRRAHPVRALLTLTGAFALLVTGCSGSDEQDRASGTLSRSPSPTSASASPPADGCARLDLGRISSAAGVHLDDVEETRTAAGDLSCSVLGGPSTPPVSVHVLAEHGTLQQDLAPGGRAPKQLTISGNEALFLAGDSSGTRVVRLVTHVDDHLLRVATANLDGAYDDQAAMERAVVAVAEGAVEAGLVTE